MPESPGRTGNRSTAGPEAHPRPIANVGAQRRDIPHPRNADDSALAAQTGGEAVRWLGARFAGTKIYFPTARGREVA